VNAAEVVQRTTLLFPGLLALVALLTPAPGYESPKDLAAAACLALLVASFLTRSDGFHAASMSGCAVLLGLEATQFGLPLAFAVAVALLFAFDIAGLVESLFGIAQAKVDLQNRATTTAYLGIIRRQAVRFSGVCFATFLISLAVVTTPIPLLAFANPVSGSGLLALSTLLLILLVASGMNLPKRAARRAQRPT